MNQAFSMTKEQYRNRTKTVTRRNGKMPPVGVDVFGIEKGQGIPKGGHVVRMGIHRFISIRDEPLRRMIDEPMYGQAECIREGFPNLTPDEFVKMYCKANNCTPDQIVHRGEFIYPYSPEETERMIAK